MSQRVRRGVCTGLVAIAGVICVRPAGAAGTAGALDPAFGTDGLALSPVAGGNLRAVAAQADGSVVAAGFETTGVGSNTRWVVRRWLANGTLDASFGTAGVARLFGSFPVDQATDVAIDASGRAVVVGKMGVATNRRGDYQTVVAVARLTTSGALDATFGSGGVATLSAWTLADARVVLMGDGRLVVGVVGSVAGKKNASASVGLGVVRLLANGSPDTSFDGDGFAIQALSTTGGGFGYSGRTVALQSDGGVIVGGRMLDASFRSVWTIVRFHPNGAADGGFGVVTGATGDVFFALRVDASDRIVAVGDRGTGAAMDTLVRRYLPTGALDPSFAQSGVFVSGLAGGDYAGDVEIQPDGAIVLALTDETAVSQVFDFAPMRLLADGTPDATYGTAGIGEATGMPSAGTWAWSIAIRPDGSAVVGGRVPGSPTQWAVGAYVSD